MRALMPLRGLFICYYKVARCWIVARLAMPAQEVATLSATGRTATRLAASLLWLRKHELESGSSGIGDLRRYRALAVIAAAPASETRDGGRG